jgi:hypothetical protein
LKYTFQKRLWPAIKRWWQGEYELWDDIPGFVVIGGRYRRHWTAEVSRAVVFFVAAHWQFVISTSLAIAGLVFAFLALR